MKSKSWKSIEEFLSENEFEFAHVETDEEYQNELDKIQRENSAVIGILNGELREQSGCRRWKPVKRRICKWVNGKYKCVTHTRYVCVD